MAITITTCPICTSDIERRLAAMRIPHTKSQHRGKTTFSINIASKPSTWDDKNRSLTASCWRGMEFTYHQAVRNGNKLSCSSAR
jgi:hypothetical protein